MPEKWRVPKHPHMASLARSVRTQIIQRHHQGKKEYGPVFVGNPFKHMREEIVDTINYSDYAEEMFNRALEIVTYVSKMGPLLANLSDGRPHDVSAMARAFLSDYNAEGYEPV